MMFGHPIQTIKLTRFFGQGIGIAEGDQIGLMDLQQPVIGQGMKRAADRFGTGAQKMGQDRPALWEYAR